MRSRGTFHLDWLQIEVSSLCNGDCAYCAQWSYRKNWRGGLMELRTFEHLGPSFADADLVFLQGWGEPLLHPDIWRMVRRVRAAGAAVGFTTNGMLLDAESLERLVEDEVSIVAISLAGTTPATHERFRPACKFLAIDQALLALAELKRKKRSEYPRVHLAFLLLRSNLEEVGGLVDLASRWGASQIVVSNLSWIVEQQMEDECTLLAPEIWPGAAMVLELARRRASAKGVLLHYHGPGVGEPRFICPENVLRACFVSHSGNVSPCVYTNFSLGADSHVSRYFDGRHTQVSPIVFGNVHERSLPEIWDSEEARQFRNTFEERRRQEHPGTAGLPAACAHCYRLREWCDCGNTC